MSACEESLVSAWEESRVSFCEERRRPAGPMEGERDVHMDPWGGVRPFSVATSRTEFQTSRAVGRALGSESTQLRKICRHYGASCWR
jgi:hypothetical protein